MNRMTGSARHFVGAIALLFIAQFGAGHSALSKTDVEARVESVLGKMTMDEKLDLIGGINDFYTRPNPRLGIPSLRMSDGPMGVHDYGLTTAYPAGIALAALWDVDLAEAFRHRYGERCTCPRSAFHPRPRNEPLSRVDECSVNGDYFQLNVATAPAGSV